MTGGVLGGGVLFATLALLWVAVLAPSWMQKRQFQVAEQNAARLQRTLRVLAETAELPEEHRVEANAHQALAHEKMLKAAKARQRAERNAILDELRAEKLLAEDQEARARKRKEAAMKTAELRSPKYRRIRLVSALVTLLGLVSVIAGVILALVGVAPWALALWSLVTVVAGMGTLVAVAPGRVRAKAAAPAEVIVPAPTRAQLIEHEPEAAPARDTVAEHAAAQARAAAERERARKLARAREAAKAKAAPQRENQPDSMLLQESSSTASAKAAAQRPAPKATPAPSGSARLRNMGVIDETVDTMDLDEVLRRRRNVG